MIRPNSAASSETQGQTAALTNRAAHPASIEFPLLLDGAMGTLFAATHHQSADQCELALLSHPEWIEEIHLRYLQAGAQALKTDTFALPVLHESQPWQARKLVHLACRSARQAITAFQKERKKQEEEAVQTNQTNPMGQNQSNISRPIHIFADLGPCNPQSSPLEVYQPLLEAFLEEGIDCFLFETLPSLEGMREVFDWLKEQNPDSFLIASCAIRPDGLSEAGLSGVHLLQKLDQIDSVDAMGFNCVTGPSHMLRIVQDLPAFSKPLSMMPNAGYPTLSNRRAMYDGLPEYFAEHILSILGQGAQIVGGCCGTTPAHIKAIHEALRKTSIAPKRKAASSIGKTQITRMPGMLDARKAAGQKAILVELDPPANDKVSGFMEKASRIHQAGADLLTIADNPIGRPRADSSILACKIQRELNIPVLPHLTCRDRNLNAIKALLLGLSMENVRQVLLVTGDPLPMQSRQEVKAVFSFNSRTLASFASSLEQEGVCQPFLKLGALDVNARNFEVQLSLAKEKEQCGMEGFLTQPVFSKRALENLKRARNELSGSLYGGILPIVSYKNACFLQNEISGMDIPSDLAARYQGLDRTQSEELALQICIQTAKTMEEWVDGYYLMTPFSRVDLMIRLIQAIRQFR